MPFTASELIDTLEKSEVIVTRKPWGSEVLITNDEFILKFIRVGHGHRTSEQYHERKDEVSVILYGEGTIVGSDDDHRRPSRPLRIRPGVHHRTVGPVTMIEVTTPDNDDVVRLADDYGRQGLS